MENDSFGNLGQDNLNTFGYKLGVMMGFVHMNSLMMDEVVESWELKNVVRVE